MCKNGAEMCVLEDVTPGLDPSYHYHILHCLICTCHTMSVLFIGFGNQLPADVMGNEQPKRCTISHAVMVPVFFVHVLDTATVCLCARVCRDWHSLATNPSSHTGVIAFRHCLTGPRFFGRFSCHCEVQLFPKITSLSILARIVSLDLCGVHLSTVSLKILAQSLRRQNIQPQRVFLWLNGFGLSPQIMNCSEYCYIYDRKPVGIPSNIFINHFINLFNWPTQNKMNPRLFTNLLQHFWGSIPLKQSSLPEPGLLLTLLEALFNRSSYKPVWNHTADWQTASLGSGDYLNLVLRIRNPDYLNDSFSGSASEYRFLYFHVRLVK